MFGDNLSMISDTTIAATRTQSVEMKDKFKANFAIALPAAIVTIVLLLVFGRPDVVPEATTEYTFNIIKVLPYLFVLVASLVGLNVFIVLTGGILFSGVIGIAMGSFTILEFANHIYTGFTGMFEIFLLSMMMGLQSLYSMKAELNGFFRRLKRLSVARRVQRQELQL